MTSVVVQKKNSSASSSSSSAVLSLLSVLVPLFLLGVGLSSLLVDPVSATRHHLHGRRGHQQAVALPSAAAEVCTVDNEPCRCMDGSESSVCKCGAGKCECVGCKCNGKEGGGCGGAAAASSSATAAALGAAVCTVDNEPCRCMEAGTENGVCKCETGECACVGCPCSDKEGGCGGGASGSGKSAAAAVGTGATVGAGGDSEGNVLAHVANQLNAKVRIAEAKFPKMKENKQGGSGGSTSGAGH